MFKSIQLNKSSYKANGFCSGAASGVVKGGAQAGLLALVLCFLVLACPIVSAAEMLDIPSITADRITRDTRSGQVISRDWIQLSSAGLRARQSEVDGSFEYLQNFPQEKLWMLDWRRKILLEATPRGRCDRG